ncbi:MAG: deoxyhypusine synthase family protein [Mariprofundaceae bacterium]|nr:deoxyhypusine synthase family protein [Mariprofundaceae bacterium]
MSLKPLSFGKLKTVPLAKRKTDADDADFGAPYRPNGSFSDFLCTLPGIGAAQDLMELRDTIVSAHRRKKSVILGCGGHVIDSGLSPLLVRLLEQRIISGLVLTGAALLQDVEIALSGHTLRSYDRDVVDGVCRVTEETGRLINEAISFGAIEGWGIGQSVGEKIIDAEPDHLDHSVLATASRYDIPVTVHPAIGADAFNLHPATHGESLGATGFTDFRLLTAMMAEASDGVIINAASSVILPRVFMQAVDAARNLGKKIEKMTCVIIDPSASPDAVADITGRLSQPGGRGIWLPGPDELLLPLLFAAVLDVMGDGY